MSPPASLSRASQIKSRRADCIRLIFSLLADCFSPLFRLRGPLPLLSLPTSLSPLVVGLLPPPPGPPLGSLTLGWWARPQAPSSVRPSSVPRPLLLLKVRICSNDDPRPPLPPSFLLFVLKPLEALPLVPLPTPSEDPRAPSLQHPPLSPWGCAPSHLLPLALSSLELTPIAQGRRNPGIISPAPVTPPSELMTNM